LVEDALLVALAMTTMMTTTTTKTRRTWDQSATVLAARVLLVACRGSRAYLGAVLGARNGSRATMVL
jgi:hypothetical protein